MSDPGTFELANLSGTWELTVNAYPPGAATALADLTDVNVPGPQDAQVLTYDDATSKWVASPPGGGVTAATLVADADLSGGTATTLDIVKPDGTVVAAAVPRATFVGNDVAVRTGDDGGSVWTVTSSGPCTLARACQAGELVSVFGGVQQYVVQASNEAGGVNGTLPGAADRFVPLDQAMIDGLEALAADVVALQDATPDGAPVGHVLADTAPYLKVGRTGAGAHDKGGFECDTDLEFTTGFDARIWFRTVAMPAGVDKFGELITQTGDAGVGAVDAYELAFYVDADGDPRPFTEHIRTGNTVEEDTFSGTKHSIGFGAVYGLRHTIDYTGGPAGVGVEKFWMAAGNDPDVVTADGIGWKLIDAKTHDVAESIEPAFTEPWCIGLSEHETHVFIVQMYDGIDGTCLVDLHASDATSTTTVTCREGTVWTAIDVATIENLGGGGGGAVDSVNGQTGVVVLDAGDVHVGGILAGQDERTGPANTVTETSLLDSTPTVTATAGEVLRVVAAGTYTQNSGAGRSPTVRLKIAGTTVLAFTRSFAQSATVRDWELTATIRVEANGDANASGTLVVLDGISSDTGTSAADLSAGQTIDITWQHPTTDATQTADLTYFFAERVRSA